MSRLVVFLLVGCLVATWLLVDDVAANDDLMYEDGDAADGATGETEATEASDTSGESTTRDPNGSSGPTAKQRRKRKRRTTAAGSTAAAEETTTHVSTTAAAATTEVTTEATTHSSTTEHELVTHAAGDHAFFSQDPSKDPWEGHTETYPTTSEHSSTHTSTEHPDHTDHTESSDSHVTKKGEKSITRGRGQVFDHPDENNVLRLMASVVAHDYSLNQTNDETQHKVDEISFAEILFRFTDDNLDYVAVYMEFDILESTCKKRAVKSARQIEECDPIIKHGVISECKADVELLVETEPDKTQKIICKVLAVSCVEPADGKTPKTTAVGPRKSKKSDADESGSGGGKSKKSKNDDES